MSDGPPPRHPRLFRRWMVLFYSAAGLLAVLYALGWWLARPPEPGPLYATDPAASSRPGDLLGAERFERDLPAGARAWRIVYATTGIDGRVRSASGLVVVASRAGTAPRPVIAWAHGTTGIARGCAPSLIRNTFAYVPALEAALSEGWAWVATDYAGLGTPGPHPYLVGPASAKAVLDAVRAARDLDELALDSRTVVWGHSQGGHAALWTGIVGPDYARDVDLRGVAAVAPATDLPELVAGVHRTFMGRMLSALLVQSYAAVYPDVAVSEVLRPWARPLSADIAGRCLGGAELIVSALPSLLSRPTLFSGEPPTGAFAARLAENVPDRAIEAPVLIAQGGRDRTVLPGVQGGYVGRRCLAGQAIDYRGFSKHDHLSIVAGDSPVPDLLIEWSRDRLAGAAAPTSCRVTRDSPREPGS